MVLRRHDFTVEAASSDWLKTLRLEDYAPRGDVLGDAAAGALFPLLEGQRKGDVLVGLGTDWASCTYSLCGFPSRSDSSVVRVRSS